MAGCNWQVVSMVYQKTFSPIRTFMLHIGFANQPILNDLAYCWARALNLQVLQIFWQIFLKTFQKMQNFCKVITSNLSDKYLANSKFSVKEVQQNFCIIHNTSLEVYVMFLNQSVANYWVLTIKEYRYLKKSQFWHVLLHHCGEYVNCHPRESHLG